ncbi:glycosyltransferase [Actinomadura scrupuli]|uniref:glycosyltransferase n=1 Tax=Actinomadura scrupuli TaxID=559629 RepID=UPI003D96D1EF
MADSRDVFIVCNNIEEMGGLQRWAHHLAGLLTGRGHHVTLIGITCALDRHDHGRDPGYDRVVLHRQWRAPVMKWRPRSALDRLNLPARSRDLWRTAALRQGAARLTELFRAARPGGVVIAAQVWAMEWVRAADTTGLKVVGMSHESYRATRRSSRYARVREHFAAADRMLALTPEDADAWARAGMSNAGDMPNPLHVSPGRYPTLEEPVVTCVGRLSHEKGVDLALEAWARVSPRHPGWRLRVYGSGPHEARLRRLARSWEISGTVEFHGTTGDIETALAGSSIFALPSRAEGFPMSVLEAMAYGLPTVAFDCAPGVRELLTDGHDGLLVWPGDTVGFATALDRLIGDEGLRRELGGHARVSVRRFDPEPVLDRWEHLFSLLDRRPGGERRVPVTAKALAAADPGTRDAARDAAAEDAAAAARGGVPSPT